MLTAVIIHSHSAPLPKIAYGTVNRYGSGFQDGAPVVLRLQLSVWCPPTRQPEGSSPGRALAHRISRNESSTSPALVLRTGCSRTSASTSVRLPSPSAVFVDLGIDGASMVCSDTRGRDGSRASLNGAFANTRRRRPRLRMAPAGIEPASRA